MIGKLFFGANSTHDVIFCWKMKNGLDDLWEGPRPNREKEGSSVNGAAQATHRASVEAFIIPSSFNIALILQAF